MAEREPADLGRRIHDVVSAHASGFEPSDDLATRVMARTRERAAHRRALATAAAVAVVLMAVGAPATLLVRRQQRLNVDTAQATASRQTATTAPNTPPPTARPRAGVTTGTQSRPPSTTAPASGSRRPATVPAVTAPPAPAAGEPATFVGAVGDEGGRQAVVSVATGDVQRFLTPTASAGRARLSADRRTLYTATSSSDPCGSTWTAVDVATGARTPAFADLGPVGDLAPSPDGTQVAYTKASGAGGACGPGDLVVKDVKAATVRSWPAPGLTVASLDWSADSRQLAVLLSAGGKTQVRLLAPRGPGASINDGLLLGPVEAGCQPWTPRFRPGTTRVVVAQNCEHGRAEVVDYERSTGATVATVNVTVAQGDEAARMIDLAVDGSGQHVLFVLSEGDGAPGRAYVLRGTTPVLVRTDCAQAQW